MEEKKKLQLIMLITSIIFFFTELISFAQGGLPSAEHPRIFLNPTVINNLNAKVTANTPEWQSFQSYLDAYSVDIPWGGEILDGIASFSLAYQMTGNTAYADRAIFFIDEWMNAINATNPFYVSENEYAHLFETVGLGYDWLYNYSGFTVQKKAEIITLINKIYNHGQLPWDQGGGEFEADPRDSDQFIGGAKTALIWGTATYGDNSNSETMINRGRKLWNENIVPWVTQSIGGVWPEGSQYSYNTLFFLLAFTEAERTANGINYWNDNQDIKNFIPNSIKALIWLTPPSNDHVLTYNDQEDENAHYWGRRNHFVAIATSIADNLGFSSEAGMGRYWIREICPTNIEMNIWKLFLWYDRDKGHTDYFNQSTPSTYFSKGLDWMFLRSNWTAQSSYSTFNASWTNVDHQFMDGGHFNIWRNGEYLTRAARHYDFVLQLNGKYQSYDGETSNILLIQSDYESDERINAMGSPEFLESAGEAQITKHRINDSPLFAYSFADLGSSYNRPYDPDDGNSTRVNSYTRQFVQISPDYYIVYDRVRTTNSGWVKYILHSLTEPTVNGNTVTQTSEGGSQTLTNRTLFPESVTISKINEAAVWDTLHGLTEDWMINESERNWHVAIQPAVSDSVNMLNIIETSTGNSVAIANAQLINSSNGIGTMLDNWIVLFGNNSSVITGNVTYQFISGGTPIHNLVCDLEANCTYNVSVNSNPLPTQITGSDGTLFFDTDALNQVCNISIEKGGTDANPTGTSTNLTGIPQVNTPISLTLAATGTGTFYYRFFVGTNYGAPWTQIQPWSTNNSCTYTPTSEGNNVFLAHVSDDPNSGSFHQAGFSFATSGHSEAGVVVNSLSSNLAFPQTTGTPITLTAQAIGSGTIYYKFWYKDDTGWHVIKDWSTDNSATWTPNQAGTFTIVVWANTTADDSIPNRPIAGLTCSTVE